LVACLKFSLKLTVLNHILLSKQIALFTGETKSAEKQSFLGHSRPKQAVFLTFFKGYDKVFSFNPVDAPRTVFCLTLALKVPGG